MGGPLRAPEKNVGKAEERGWKGKWLLLVCGNGLEEKKHGHFGEILRMGEAGIHSISKKPIKRNDETLPQRRKLGWGRRLGGQSPGKTVEKKELDTTGITLNNITRKGSKSKRQI